MGHSRNSCPDPKSEKIKCPGLKILPSYQSPRSGVDQREVPVWRVPTEPWTEGCKTTSSEVGGVDTEFTGVDVELGDEVFYVHHSEPL